MASLLRRNTGCLITSSVGREYKNGCGPITSFLNAAFIQYRTLKSDLKIKWVKPPKVPCYVPEKSGDLKQIEPLNLQNLQPEVEKTKEIQDANDLVKQVLSLQFTRRCEQTKVMSDIMINSVKDHKLDTDSWEAKIARRTVQIRRLQDHVLKFRKDVYSRVALKEAIEKRKKYLKMLRRQDYKRFEWLLEKLDIVYRPKPEETFVVTRKDSLTRLTKEYCSKIKNERIEAYKNTLNAQKLGFLQKKIEKLQWIRNEEIECGVEPTITDTDIEMVKEQLQVLKMAKETEERAKDQEA